VQLESYLNNKVLEQEANKAQNKEVCHCRSQSFNGWIQVLLNQIVQKVRGHGLWVQAQVMFWVNSQSFDKIFEKRVGELNKARHDIRWMEQQ
jgi:hypothetical protein